MSHASFTPAGKRGARFGVAILAMASCLMLSLGASAAPAGPSAEADAASIEACLGDPSMSGRDPHECGDRVTRQCLADANGAGATGSALACEKRRADAWILIARRTYHALEAKLGEADRHLLRASQAQFELELRDLCALARSLAGVDLDLAAASCASDLDASRALSLLKLARRGAQPR